MEGKFFTTSKKTYFSIVVIISSLLLLIIYTQGATITGEPPIPEESACSPEEPPFPECVEDCLDSDDGDEPQIPGKVIYNEKVYQDSCEEKENTLTEYFCSDQSVAGSPIPGEAEGRVSEKTYNCNFYCKNEYGANYEGKCVLNSVGLGYCNCITNAKDSSKYRKQAFLISDQDWRDVLSLVPITTWTSKEDSKWCQKGYGTATNTCVYPTLIWHNDVLKKINTGNKFFKNTLLHIFAKKNDEEDFGRLPRKPPQLRECEIWGVDIDALLVTDVSSDEEEFEVGEEISVRVTIKNCYPETKKIKTLKIEVPKKFIEGIPSSEKTINEEIEPNEEKIFTLPLKFEKALGKSFDVDSIIYFLQQYSPDRLTIVGPTPSELDKLLEADPTSGAGLEEAQIQRISVNDYFSYWSSFNKIVYVEEDYKKALLASTYASLINAPLIIQNSNLDKSNLFMDREVVLVGNVECPSGANCKEKYTLEGLQKKYVEETKTDKIILVNPKDLNIKVTEDFQPEKSSYPISEIYSKTSLAAPILASAKYEVIIGTQKKNYKEVDNFIETKINELGINPEYLTIIANPNAIEMSYRRCITPDYCNWYSADAWHYSKLPDKDPLLDLATGRILGITVSDVSANIARSNFYSETLKNPDKVLVTRGLPCITDAAKVYTEGTAISSIGYKTTIDPKTAHPPKKWKEKFLIVYLDHGGTNWAGIGSDEIPLLDNSFIITEACLTCSFMKSFSKGKLFCSNIIRKGGIGYIGATDVSGYLNHPGLLVEILGQGHSIGESFRNAENAVMVYDNQYENISDWYTLTGDPTLQLSLIKTFPTPTFIFSEKKDNKRIYKLTVPAMRFEIPQWVRKLTEVPKQAVPLYFTTVFNRQLNINYEFVVRFASPKDFNPNHIKDEKGKWKLVKETDRNKDYLWIRSPYSSYFSNANDQQFTYYKFTLELWE